MKNIFLILSLLISISVSANYLPESKINGQAFIGTVYMNSKKCELAYSEKCHKVPFGYNHEYHELVDEMVDDETKPVYEAKSNIVACAAVLDNPATTEVDESKTLEQDCLEKEAAQVCDTVNKYYAVRVQDNSEVYCTKFLHFEKKPSGKKIVGENAVKKSAYELNQITVNALKERKVLRRKSRIFGNDLIDEITIRNEDRVVGGELTLAQIDQLTILLNPITAALQIGSIPTAKKKILELSVDGTLVRQSDVDFAIGKIDSFLGL